MEKFTEETTLAEALKHPKAEEILAKYKMPCLWCPMAKHEAQHLKIGQICQIYQIDAKKLLKELNQKIENKKIKSGTSDVQKNAS